MSALQMPGVDTGCAPRSAEGAVTTRCLVILLILAYVLVLLVIVATYIVTTPQPSMPPAPSYLPEVPT